jgi:hypothetical protein
MWKGIAGTKLALRSITHFQRHAALQDVADVLDLARVGARERLHVPAPTRFERSQADCMPIQVNAVHATLPIRELPNLIRAFETLPDKPPAKGAPFSGRLRR